MPSQKLEQAQRLLRKSYGIELAVERGGDDLEAAGFDAVAEIIRGSNRIRTYVEARESIDEHDASKLASHWHAVAGLASPPRELVVVAERISSTGARLLAHRGVQYIDLSNGAVHLQFGDVLIDVQPRAAARVPDRTGRTVRESAGMSSTQLFSSKRAQVTVALLTWPRLAALPVRTLALAAGVSTGLAHETVALLHEQGYLTHETLIGPARLLREWGSAYPAGLGSALTLKTYSGDATALTIPPAVEGEVSISGEWAVQKAMRQLPMTVSIYVPSQKQITTLAMSNRWERARDTSATITVRQTFWAVPDEAGALLGGSSIKGVHRAPWPLIYGDLLALGDARLREIAENFASAQIDALERAARA